MPVTESPTGVRTGPRSSRAGSDATILARLWGALAREPLPGLAGRDTRGDALTLRWVDGTVLTGEQALAQPFAVAPPGFAVAVTAPGAATAREVREPGELVRTLGGVLGRHAARLAEELDNSAANLALARAAAVVDGGQPLLTRAARQPDPLAYLEQSVVDGHPLHPCARTRMGLTPAYVRAYAPEHRPPPVALRSVVVPPGRWYGVGCPPRLWLHPWQHERLRDEHPWLSSIDSEIPARPLMALRSLALVADHAHHVKTAVDIQMTSAVRTVSPASIHNGRMMTALLSGLGRRAPGLAVVPELGGGAALVDGAPDRRLAVVHRRLPPLRPGELAVPLAALTAPSPATGAPVLTELGDPLSLVEDLATALLPPVFRLLEFGVALEAHGQNVLGVFRAGRLARLLYRDFGGVRVSAHRLRRHGIEPPVLRGDVPSDDPEVLRTKVLASATATVLGEVVAVLARHSGLDEARAWQRVAAVGRTLTGPDAVHLFGATVPIKAMTAMRLADDATADLWCTVPNPMAGLG